MLGTIGRSLSAEAHKRLSVLSTAYKITFHPSAFADEAKVDTRRGVVAAGRYFLTCVGVVLALEAVISLVFRTAFSDLVHHSFPVFVALLGAFTMHALLSFEIC